MNAEPPAGGPRAFALRCALGVVVASLLSACEPGMKDMYHQDKYQPLDASQLWKDGRSARPLVPGTVPYSEGVRAETSSGVRGEQPPAVSGGVSSRPAALKRGEERYGIFCAPCHGASGEGNGYIVMRGFPRPPSYHIDRLRTAPDSYIYEVIANGHGIMYGYGERIDTSDRWAIVSYLRALQLAHRELPADTPKPESPARTTAVWPPAARGSVP